jgi:hypothetical protein
MGDDVGGWYSETQHDSRSADVWRLVDVCLRLSLVMKEQRQKFGCRMPEIPGIAPRPRTALIARRRENGSGGPQGGKRLGGW